MNSHTKTIIPVQASSLSEKFMFVSAAHLLKKFRMIWRLT